MKNIEEIKTYVGIMMTDLRGNWAFDYVDRMEDVREELTILRAHADASSSDQQYALEDIELIDEEIRECEFDGRIFRDCANFYNYCSKEGFTEQVQKELEDMMSYPENLDSYRKEQL